MTGRTSDHSRWEWVRVRTKQEESFQAGPATGKMPLLIGSYIPQSMAEREVSPKSIYATLKDIKEFCAEKMQ